MSNDSAGTAATAPQVSIADVQRRVLEAVQTAVKNEQPEQAHCLAETYETLVRAQTMDHQAMRVAAERALRQLEEARARTPAGANAAVPPSTLGTA